MPGIVDVCRYLSRDPLATRLRAGHALKFLLILYVSVHLALPGTQLQAGVEETKDSASQEELRVSHRARSLQPGEVVLVEIQTSGRVDRMIGKIFDREVPFEVDKGLPSPHWWGLVGLDLEVSPGDYVLEVDAFEQGRTVGKVKYVLQVEKKDFPTRRLTLPKRFVNPPKEALGRIRKESRKISALFGDFAPGRRWEGPFDRPTEGAPTSSFGKRSILNGQPRSPHTGTDFQAAKGTPVMAPNFGKVVLADDLYYSGNTIILDHGQGLYSYFAHLQDFKVSQDALVSKGRVIGSVGATGRVTGPHLHWSVRLRKARVDPLSLIAVLSSSRFPK